MKNIVFKKEQDLKKRTKKLTLVHKSADKTCITEIRKSFEYKVTSTDETQPQVQTPQVFIKKSFNTKEGIERVDFQVKGSFYISQNRFLYKIHFHHTLDIQIVWKDKAFSPKKSAVLT